MGEATTERRFIKSLGSLETFFLGFGAMIGFGWIVLTGDWLNSAGTFGAVSAFVIGGIIMALVGLVYSELVSAMPLAGGEHNYLLRGFDPRLALLGSWGIVGGYITVVAFEAVAIPRTVAYIFPQVHQIPLWTIADSQVHLTWALIGSGTAVLLTWLNIRGIKPASLFQTSVIIFVVVVAVVMLAAAIFGGEPSHAEPLFTGGGAGIIAVLVMVPFLFVGFDVIPQSAEEVNLPARKIGRLVVVSVLAAAAFYILIVLTTSVALPATEMGDFDLATADAMAVLMGSQFWGNLVVAGGLAGLLTSWNAFLIGASRLIWAMANSGMLPAWFAVLHRRNGTPVNALLFIGGISVIAPFFGEVMLVWLVDSGSPSIVITYLLVALVFLVLRRREPDMPRPMKVGSGSQAAGTAVGVAAVASSALMLILYLPGMPAFLEPQPWIMFGLWWLLGITFMLRLPGGVTPGPRAEEDLLAALAARRRRRSG
ncbi:APC family permease [Nesterenkonia sp. PF2B19]|uniref:APC family permease n=1 Tax=Nesterenkonia sp. PF2B19 TaxID=1881858 RepID=UPI00087314D3|nr:APC family permease [Nesterenkonia sp. PF2B19]OSM42967.1 amino acid permease [Nesterenkonia sp. PF2B19]